MTQENSAQAAQALLAHFQTAIEALGYPTRLVGEDETGPEVPGPLLLVGIERDQSERERTLNLMVMPSASGEDFNHLTLVQIYAALPFTVPPAHHARLVERLAAINNRVSAGHFGVTAAGAVFLRYVWTLPKPARMPEETIQQLLILFVYLLNIFSPEIEAAGGKEAGGKEAGG